MFGRLLTFVLVAGLARVGAAQSINIDFGDASGTPAADYGAAGTPGAWNTICGYPGPHALVGLDGRALQATVTIMNECGATDDPATSGDDEHLFDDGLYGLGDVVSYMTFDHLAPGEYEVIVYAWTPAVPADVTGVMVFDEYGGFWAGGAWPGAPEEGVTHVVVDALPVDGTLAIGFVGNIIGTNGFLNGIQLSRTAPEAFSPADLDEDGVVGFSDLLILLGQWTGGHGCDGILECLGDLDHDLDIDFSDLLALLAAWG